MHDFFNYALGTDDDEKHVRGVKGYKNSAFDTAYLLSCNGENVGHDAKYEQE